MLLGKFPFARIVAQEIFEQCFAVGFFLANDQKTERFGGSASLLVSEQIPVFTGELFCELMRAPGEVIEALSNRG